MLTNEIAIKDGRIWVLEEAFDVVQSIAECCAVGLNQVVHVDVILDELFLDSIFRHTCIQVEICCSKGMELMSTS